MSKLSRKEFLQHLGALYGGIALNGLMGGSMKAYAQLPHSAWQAIANNRSKILVIVQLGGGNDGLNTLIPAEDDLYQKARPTLGIKKENALGLGQSLYLHPSMAGLKRMYDEGMVSVIQNVGYPNPNRSHFRATDIWNTGSSATEVLEEGWAGRFLLDKHPKYPLESPSHPLAVQLGSVESLLFSSVAGGTGTVFEDPNVFYQLVNGSQIDDEAPIPGPMGEELEFLKRVSSSAIRFANVIREAGTKGKNTYAYANTGLSRQMGIVGKLISGGLQTQLYLVNIGGFDTHANQLNAHANLLKTLSEALFSFQNDMKNQQLDHLVSVMTFSEFGRRVNQNGTAGTDHGTCAPQFVVGSSVRGGIIGNNPNLKVLDRSGDMVFQYDYRQIYSTVLRDHFGLENTKNQVLFKGNFERLPIYKNSVDQLPENASMALNLPRPNPASESVFLQYDIFQDADIRLEVFDHWGRSVEVLDQGPKKSNAYAKYFNVQSWGAGPYIISLSNAQGERHTQRLMVVH